MLLVPKPPRRDKQWWARPLVGLVLTLVVHAGFVGLVMLVAGPSQPAPKAVTLRPLSAVQWAQNRGPAAEREDGPSRPAQRDAPEREKPKPPEEMPKGQIVDVAPGNNEVDPNSKFIAETNNRADRQTRAREQTAFYRNAMPQRTAPQRIEGTGQDLAERAQKSGNDGLGEDDRPLREADPKRAFEIPDLKRQQEVALKAPSTEGPGIAVANRGETEEVKGNSQRFNVQPGAQARGEEGSAGRRGQAGVLNLMPSPAVLDKITGAAANDHLQDVDEGDGTYLSTREWKYASFFNRVKQSVGQQWDPQLQLRLRDPTGNIYGGRDRYTLLAVTLDHDGRLKDAYVEKSSGLDFLDLEAVKAFERAQPFPNPPPGILASDQTVRFQFGFFLEMTGRPGLRLFRSTD